MAPAVMVLSSMVVLLSLFVLFQYLSGGVINGEASELSVQKQLAMDSAADYANYMYGDGLLADDETPSPVVTGGFVSTFRTVEGRRVDGTVVGFPLPEMERVSLAGSSRGVVLAGAAGDSLHVSCFQPSPERREKLFSLSLSSLPQKWFLYDASENTGWLCLVLCDFQEVDTLYAVDAEGSVISFPLDRFSYENRPILTSGVTSAIPAALIARGPGAVMVDGSQNNISYMGSPRGTVPVILPDGTVYGEPVEQSEAAEAGVPVMDVFFDDFDRDGYCDAAWAAEGALVCYSTAIDTLVRDSPGEEELAAWGYTRGGPGMGGLWQNAEGELQWREFVVTGFQPAADPDPFILRSRGRILSDGFSRSASVDGRSVIAADSSGRVVVSVQSALADDLDGSSFLDMAWVTSDSLMVHLDPAGPGSSILTVEITTGQTRSEEDPSVMRVAVRALSQESISFIRRRRV